MEVDFLLAFPTATNLLTNELVLIRLDSLYRSNVSKNAPSCLICCLRRRGYNESALCGQRQA